MGSKKVKEHTTKESFLGIDSWHKSILYNPQTGKIEGVGRSRDKGDSIDKAYKDRRERRGRV